MPRRVLVVYRIIPQYRARFFELLRSYLAQEDVALGVVYGRPEPDDARKRDWVRLDWAVERPTLLIPVGRRHLLWQSCLGIAARADLVIVEQASRLLVNYPLLALQSARVTRMAFWGHGRTPKATPPSRLGEAAKGFLSRRAHWWFAYNERGVELVRDLGVSPDRITDVQNAVDTKELRAADEALSVAEVDAERRRLGLTGANVCLFVGALYREKRLPYLITACELLRQRVPDFEMLFIGTGPDRGIVEAAAARNPWMRYLGPLHDERRVLYYRLADLVLMPGGVGLGVLDAFTLRTPLVTTDVPYHGPEIGYLRDGLNGVVVRGSPPPAVFADRVAGLLEDADMLEDLRAGCVVSADVHSVERMARNFADGILTALAAGQSSPAAALQ